MNESSYRDGPRTTPGDAEVETLADTMFALSTPSRLQILEGLRDGPRTVSEIIDIVGMEQSAVSHQLRTLRDHALVAVERRGRERLYRLRTGHVAALLDEGWRHIGALEHDDRGDRELSGRDRRRDRDERGDGDDDGRAEAPAA